MRSLELSSGNAFDWLFPKAIRMTSLPAPGDRPDPMESMPAIRARVPTHVATGQISTGVIVVTGATEYILDFVRNLPRPNLIVARVVLPHSVMPQFIDALSNNIALYRPRFGELNPNPSPMISASLDPNVRPTEIPSTLPTSGETQPRESSSGPTTSSGIGSSPTSNPASMPNEASSSNEPPLPPANPPITRHPSPQEVYDELKLKDELLSGCYANAVMIGHGPHEFCFDFITNFYPQSAVSCRVYMAAGHISRLLESLRASWEQLKPRLGGNPPF